MVLGNFEELEEKLSSRLPVNGGLLTEKVESGEMEQLLNCTAHIVDMVAGLPHDQFSKEVNNKVEVK